MYFKENCLQYAKKIIKVKLKAWHWGNDQDTPEGLEVIIAVTEVLEDGVFGDLLASDSLPKYDDKIKKAALIKYPVISSIALVDESDVALFVGYPNTYAPLEEMLKES